MTWYVHNNAYIKIELEVLYEGTLFKVGLCSIF